MFNFEAWLDARCIESYGLEWDTDLGCPVRSLKRHRILFVSKPYPVYLKDRERVYAPWWPSNDWTFKEWKRGNGGKFGIDWDTVDYDNYMNCGRGYGQ